MHGNSKRTSRAIPFRLDAASCGCCLFTSPFLHGRNHVCSGHNCNFPRHTQTHLSVDAVPCLSLRSLGTGQGQGAWLPSLKLCFSGQYRCNCLGSSSTMILGLPSGDCEVCCLCKSDPDERSLIIFPLSLIDSSRKQNSKLLSSPSGEMKPLKSSTTQAAGTLVLNEQLIFPC